MDHHQKALNFVTLAHEGFLEESGSLTPHGVASLASAHAVLALIDIIQGDRENEIQEANQRITELENERNRLRRDIGLIGIENDELREQLAGAYDTVRRHEQAAANEKAATNNDLRKSYE